MKTISVSCIGLGMRADIYLSKMFEMKGKYKITALCDLNKQKTEYYAKKFDVEKENVFTTDEEFFSKVRADLLIVGTQDKDHVINVIDGLKCGYKNFLVEKPFATSFKDIKLIEKLAAKENANIYICHVLRYAPAFKKAKEMIDSGLIGELKSIEALERVSLFHHSHSYVRGHYRDSKIASPMIMAKCCHDLDLLVWYANSLCKSISSLGKLTYFVNKNKPEGASDRCFNCKYSNECIFNAKTVYFEKLQWAKEYATQIKPYSDEALIEDLKTSNFGECVFNGKNNVVDNQEVMIDFENGVEATLHMTAFTTYGGRRYHFFGTKGDILLDETHGILRTYNINGDITETEISKLVSSKEGHGGGDSGLVEELYEIYNGKSSKSCTTLAYSIESHKMALFAEKSRLKNGKIFKLR